MSTEKIIDFTALGKYNFITFIHNDNELKIFGYMSGNDMPELRKHLFSFYY